MTAASYDVVVIGGGIHGAGVAQAAAARGYSVLVLEQSRLAAGTSSRSSKLIHGGLRYLETGQFALVKECLHEREVLLRLAPELVKLRSFYLPVYRLSRRSALTIRVGLSLYAVLGRLAKEARFNKIPRRQWEQLDGLDTYGLRAVYRYYDAQTDDAALTAAVMASAQRLGAQLRVPASFLRAQLDEDGVDIEYQSGSTASTCRARVVVNAAGPWINQVLAKFAPAVAQLQVQLVQGTHILVAGKLTQGIYYAPAPSDQRPVFIMPWRDHVLVGTTEHAYRGDPAAVTPLPEERTYLLETLSYYFPHYRSEQTARIVDAFSGLRVLPQGGANLSGRPRDTLLHVDRSDRPRVLSVYGGKLTAYRATAARVLERLAASLPSRTPHADTAQLALNPVD